jgi:hypothetical protein
VADRNRETLLKRLVRYVRDFLIHIFETDEHLKAWIEMLKEELDQLAKDNSFEELVSEKKNNNLYEKYEKKKKKTFRDCFGMGIGSNPYSQYIKLSFF